MNKVRFNLKDRNESETLINLVYRYEGKRLKMSTGIKVNPKHWNYSKQRVREKAGHFEYPGYNARLDRLEQAVKKAYSYFQMRGENPSLIQMKAKISEGVGKVLKSNEKPLTVVEFIKSHIEVSEANGMKYGTLSGFKQLLKVVESMDDSRALEFKDLSEYRLHEMTKLMVGKFNYSTDQINKIQKKLITVVNRAKENPIYSVNRTFSVRNPSWKVRALGSAESGRGLAFTSKELKRIESVALSGRLEKVRDRFLIGVEVGQRYSDFYKLNIDNVVLSNGIKVWDIVQSKTGKLLKIPVSEKSVAILQKYDGYPPSISLSNFNKYLKEVCKAARIEDIQIVRKRNPLEGVVFEQRVPKWELVSSHDCRRTLATLMNKQGKPLTSIMSITGHKSLRELQKYLKIDQDAPIVDAINLY